MNKDLFLNYIKTKQEVVFVFVICLLLSTSSFANEGDKIMRGAGEWILMMMVIFALTILMLVFIAVKPAKKRFFALSSINLFLFLLIFFTSDSQDYFLLDRIYVFYFQAICQLLISLILLPMFILRKE